MPEIVQWSVTALGGVLVLLVLRDVFHTIWHPGGRGRLSSTIMAAVWWAGSSRRWRSRAGTGPTGLLLVVLGWVLLVVLGGALVYWPHLPDAFSFDVGLVPATRDDLLDAVYLSAVTLTTLGFGDVVPVAGWLRIAVPVQALVGFALLTAAVSWVLQVYPALARRRAVAVRLALLRRVGTAGLVTGGPSPLAARLLHDVAGELAQVRIDATQYAETHYFREADADASLPAMLGVALDLAERASASPDRDVRFAGEYLEAAVADLLAVADEEFLRVGGDVRSRCAAYAEAHGHEVAHAL